MHSENTSILAYVVSVIHMGKKEIKYRTPADGIVEKEFLAVEDVNCVGQNDGEHKALIIQHEDDEERLGNTVIEPVTELYRVRDV